MTESGTPVPKWMWQYSARSGPKMQRARRRSSCEKKAVDVWFPRCNAAQEKFYCGGEHSTSAS